MICRKVNIAGHAVVKNHSRRRLNMSGKIDPFFADHPFFGEQKKRADEFLETWRKERIDTLKARLLDDISGDIAKLEGGELDNFLRELGIDPGKLLTEFDAAIDEASPLSRPAGASPVNPSAPDASTPAQRPRE
jgi:hypothetical protein